MLILLTGATGKVGRQLIDRLLSDPRWRPAKIRALCHNRLIDESARLSVVRGTIAERETVKTAMRGATHVIHMATCKETPDDIMDVAIKGLFWLLEAFRENPNSRQFVLIGGDATVGHFFHRHEGPITEATPHRAYPGCYALSKALEEAMLQQYYAQYDINGCCLRAPWIMEKDDFKFSLSFGDDLFGGPDWKTMVPKADAARYQASGTIPLLQDADGRPLKRNFVHVEDLVSAILEALDNPQARQQLFNICMDEPVDYGQVAAYLSETRGLPSVTIPSGYHSNWMDNSKAKLRLGWRPKYDFKALIDSAWNYARSLNEPRKVWYPG